MKLWQNMTRGSAEIEYIYDDGAVRYISFCNTPPKSFELIEPYGLELMEKKRLIKGDPTPKSRKSSWHPDDSEEIIEEPIPQRRRHVIRRQVTVPPVKRVNYILRKAPVMANG